MLTRATADRVGVGIGDGFTVAGWCTGDGDPIELSEPIDVVVTGVSIGAFDVEPPGSGQTIEPAYVDETVVEALYAADAERPPYNAVWLVDDSTADVARELDGYDVVLDLAEQTAIIDEALDADARPMWILAAAGALTGILLLAPIIDRNIREDIEDVATLVALGCTRTQIGLRAVSNIVVLAAGGVVIAILAAPLIAALLPLGLAGVIVGDDVWFDVAVTALGIVLLVAALAAVSALSTWRLAVGPRTSRPVTTLTADRAVGSLRLRPPAQTGVMAAVGRPAGRRLVSPWPGIVSLVLACTVCVAGLTYVAGLRNLEQKSPPVGMELGRRRVHRRRRRGPFQGGRRDRAVRRGRTSDVGHLCGHRCTSRCQGPTSKCGPGRSPPDPMPSRRPWCRAGPQRVPTRWPSISFSAMSPASRRVTPCSSNAPLSASRLHRSWGNGGSAVVIEPPDDEPVVATFEVTGIAVLPTDRPRWPLRPL